jgi:hypothetical protein
VREEKHTVGEKTYLGGMFSYFMDDEKKFCQDIKMQKMTGFLDEKYTPRNMKNMQPEGPIFW